MQSKSLLIILLLLWAQNVSRTEAGWLLGLKGWRTPQVSQFFRNWASLVPLSVGAVGANRKEFWCPHKENLMRSINWHNQPISIVHRTEHIVHMLYKSLNFNARLWAGCTRTRVSDSENEQSYHVISVTRSNCYFNLWNRLFTIQVKFSKEVIEAPICHS